jgi:hypothetical protein
LPTSIGVPALAGPFILATVAYFLDGLALLVLLRPDPLVVANTIENVKKTNESIFSGENFNTLTINKRGIVAGATVMVLTQIVMVTIMTMTPVHMGHYGHSLKEIGLVIGFHIGSMYLPSLVPGILVGKIGRTGMAMASGVTLFCWYYCGSCTY